MPNREPYRGCQSSKTEECPKFDLGRQMEEQANKARANYEKGRN